jgi:hypothetical protein
MMMKDYEVSPLRRQGDGEGEGEKAQRARAFRDREADGIPDFHLGLRALWLGERQQ